MTGHRKANHNFPEPDIRYLERKEFHGRKMFFKEAIPVIEPLTKKNGMRLIAFYPEQISQFISLTKLKMKKIIKI